MLANKLLVLVSLEKVEVKWSRMDISRINFTPVCYFSILGITATQLSLAITEPSIVPNKLFSSYKKCIFIIAYYYYSLHWNGFSPRPSSAYGVCRLRDCPTLVLILLLYTALTSKALRSTMISDVLHLIPGTPSMELWRIERQGLYANVFTIRPVSIILTILCLR